MELVLGVSAGTDGQHHLPQKRQRTSHLLLTHPVLHQAEVGVVGCQQPQQSRMKTWVQQSTNESYISGFFTFSNVLQTLIDNGFSMSHQNFTNLFLIAALKHMMLYLEQISLYKIMMIMIRFLNTLYHISPPSSCCSPWACVTKYLMGIWSIKAAE